MMEWDKGLIIKNQEEPVPRMKWQGEVAYLEFPGLAKLDCVKHLFSTRIGGVSEAEFASMNLSFTRGDNPQHVIENYRRIAAVLGCCPEDMVATYQTHTTNLRVVTKEDCGNGVTRDKTFFDVDGLITNEPGIVLLAYFADCVPLYFVDPVERVIALCHSGWKGTVNGIGGVTIETLMKEFGIKPENLHVAIGPSICQDCYEVSEDLLEAFERNFWKKYANQHSLLCIPIEKAKDETKKALFWKKQNGKYQLNLWLANQMIFDYYHIPQNQIEVTNLCTCCNPEILFSHRASKGKRGNLCGFLALKE